ncbi:hypothetical protein PybrP1_001106 [[Pythium] brassicae (nom. inval.)]|nr:hypothetical protein PybrP1_001106 [[Pythium] brassicae (nom. inval.)]
MIWPGDGVDPQDAAARQLQKKLEYARELELQIALRRARQLEEQQAAEALERKLQPAERSPSRWLVDGGGDGGGGSSSERSPFRFPPRSPLPAAPSAGEPSGAQDAAAREEDAMYAQPPHPHARFRITDLQDQSDRLRERAQQLEWRRALDEQVRENARLKQPAEQERRHADAEAAREEMAVLREQQLRAQRRLGLPETHTQPRAKAYGFDPEAVVMPPAAPSHLELRTSGARLSSGPSPTQYQYQPQYQPHEQMQQSFEALDMSRSVVIDEYRALLTEIRREREELRQEKAALRNEREELRLERTLLQLENERMASLVDAQRRANEQHAGLALQRRQQQQQEASRPPSRDDDDFDYRSPPRSLASRRPPAFDFSQLQRVDHAAAAAALGLGPRADRERRPSPITMDDFAVPHHRLTANVVDSPRRQRLAQVRARRAAAADASDAAGDDDEPNALDQSLVGESVFVALRPDEVPIAASWGPPRITETASPHRGAKLDASDRSELRSSRVITSRGFYNFENEADAFPKRQRAQRERTRREARSADNTSRSRGRRAHEASSKPSETGDIDNLEFQARASSAGRRARDAEEAKSDADDAPELSRSMFQVKVLVPGT